MTTQTLNASPISKGDKFTAAGKVWTVTGCGNGRYGLRCEGSIRALTFTMRCEELHADLASGVATKVQG